MVVDFSRFGQDYVVGGWQCAGGARGDNSRLKLAANIGHCSRQVFYDSFLVAIHKPVAGGGHEISRKLTNVAKIYYCLSEI